MSPADVTHDLSPTHISVRGRIFTDAIWLMPTRITRTYLRLEPSGREDLNTPETQLLRACVALPEAMDSWRLLNVALTPRTTATRLRSSASLHASCSGRWRRGISVAGSATCMGLLIRQRRKEVLPALLRRQDGRATADSAHRNLQQFLDVERVGLDSVG